MISELEAQDITSLSGSYLEPLALFGSTPKIRESAIRELARRVISTEKFRSEAGRKGGLANKGKPKAPRDGKNKGGWHQQKRNLAKAQSSSNKTFIKCVHGFEIDVELPVAGMHRCACCGLNGSNIYIEAGAKWPRTDPLCQACRDIEDKLPAIKTIDTEAEPE